MTTLANIHRQQQFVKQAAISGNINFYHTELAELERLNCEYTNQLTHSWIPGVLLLAFIAFSVAYFIAPVFS